MVTELSDDTFYAVIWMEREGSVISIDSRPSDALALALRLDCPIFVEDEVLKNSKAGSHRVGPYLCRRTAQVAGRPERRGPGPLQDVNRRGALAVSSVLHNTNYRTLNLFVNC